MEKFKLNDHTFLVTKFAQGGDLCTYLEALGVKYLTESHAHFLFKQIAEGVNHMHTLGIVHRDLKHLNILASETSSQPRMKIADFGVATKLEKSNKSYEGI